MVVVHLRSGRTVRELAATATAATPPEMPHIRGKSRPGLHGSKCVVPQTIAYPYLNTPQGNMMRWRHRLGSSLNYSNGLAGRHTKLDGEHCVDSSERAHEGNAQSRIIINSWKSIVCIAYV